MELRTSNIINKINEISDVVFLDESEASIIKGTSLFESIGPNLVITNGSKGSRILKSNDEIIKINTVKCDNIVDATGCGDTYMAAFISSMMNGHDLEESGNFASLIASKKLEQFGPFKRE